MTPDKARMVAGMREDWGVKWDDDPNGPGRGRIVRRYVTEPEEL